MHIRHALLLVIVIGDKAWDVSKRPIREDISRTLAPSSPLQLLNMAVTEGFAPLEVPGAGKPCQTYYKIFGDLKSGVTPLIGLHGGPGATMNYMLSMADLAEAPYGIPVVLYDQVGCGGSTLLPEKAGDAEFWTVQLFVDEFHNLTKHLGIETYDVLGHSWGSMLGQEIAVRQPVGLRRLIFSSGLSSMKLWEEATRKLLETLPTDVVVRRGR